MPRLMHIDCGHGTYRCVYHFAKVLLGPCAGEEEQESGREPREDEEGGGTPDAQK